MILSMNLLTDTPGFDKSIFGLLNFKQKGGEINKFLTLFDGVIHQKERR